MNTNEKLSTIESFAESILAECKIAAIREKADYDSIIRNAQRIIASAKRWQEFDASKQ